MGTPLGPKYIPYTYMDPLGQPNNRPLCEARTAAGQLRDPLGEQVCLPCKQADLKNPEYGTLKK